MANTRHRRGSGQPAHATSDPARRRRRIADEARWSGRRGSGRHVTSEGSVNIRVLVVDDEPLARRNVTVLLQGDPDIGSIAECGSGAEAIEAIRQSKPDLVFLDVQMPECGGFDVLEQLGTHLPRVVIFVTAYDAYALRAFEAGALDYLLKPFDDARFRRALHRAKDRIVHSGPPDSQPAKRL